VLPANPLNRPFPDREFGRETIIGAARVGAFVFFALFLLRPFGMHVKGNLPLTCLGYALVTFAVSILYAYVTDRWLGWKKSGDGWSLWKWILDCALLLFFISVGNFIFYNATVGWTAFAPIVLATITVPTVIIGLFPIAFSGMAVQLRAERENHREAKMIRRAAGSSMVRPGGRDAAPVLIALTDSFSVSPDALLFCEARQNYVRIVYFREGVAAEEIVRATLSGVVERMAAMVPLLRCHRSYLVNAAVIREARGNAQGLKLSIVGTEEEVPVSRAYVAVLREHLEK